MYNHVFWWCTSMVISHTWKNSWDFQSCSGSPAQLQLHRINVRNVPIWRYDLSGQTGIVWDGFSSTGFEIPDSQMWPKNERSIFFALYARCHEHPMLIGSILVHPQNQGSMGIQDHRSVGKLPASGKAIWNSEVPSGNLDRPTKKITGKWITTS